MKQILLLNGTWRRKSDDVEAEAPVPGEVHVDLYRAGVIPDPYYGLNANEVQWVEEKEWTYGRSFDVWEDFLQKKTFLEFDGLDTFATVFLNGREVGRAANMFIPHRFNVTDTVVVGPNEVEVRLEPTAKVLAGMSTEGLFGCFDTSRVNARKMQRAFGWDWTHRFVGAGIWRDARLVSCDSLSIADVHIESEIVGNHANAWIMVEVENHTGEDAEAVVSIVVALGEDREKIELVETISPFGGVIEAVIRIEEPELWWPNGFGQQPLYTCMAGLQAEGEVQDVAERRFGVRTVEIAERDERGSNVFTLVVNGEEVFCKGANWVPADYFVSNVAPDRYRELVRLAKDANLNMLRVWGGGIHEDPAFYDACDETGVMVWQDFMFACATYPDSDDFAREVAREAEAVVKELRNHPSIVVWCGNNECEMNFAPDQDWPGKRLFHEVIPNVLKRLDRTRPYRPSTPFGGATGNDPTQGTWHGGSWFKAYLGDHTRWRHMIEEDRAPFVAEFHAQGSPAVESLRQFIPEGELFPPTGEVWEFHNKENPHSGRTDGLSQQQTLVDLTQRMMGEFSSAEQFAAYSGILQGEFVRAEIEHFRREKWAISGAVYWMFNDCRPAVGWSLIDYYLRPKPAYYYVKRACAPVIVSFKQLEDRVQAYVTSDDRLNGVEGLLRVGVFTFETCGFDAETVPVRLGANASRSFWESGPLDAVLSDPSRQCLVAMLESGGGVDVKAAYFPRVFAEMQFPLPKLLVEREQVEERRHRMVIASNAYARNVSITSLPVLARPSDNYFDLLPGERYEVVIDNLSVEEANEVGVTVWGR